MKTAMAADIIFFWAWSFLLLVFYYFLRLRKNYHLARS